MNMSVVQTTRVSRMKWLSAHMRTSVLLQTLLRCASNPSMWSARIHASPTNALMTVFAGGAPLNVPRPKFAHQATINAQISLVLKAWLNTANVLN